MSSTHRKELLDIASEYDFLIIEDDPYGELIFEGSSIKPIKSYDTKGHGSSKKFKFKERSRL